MNVLPLIFSYLFLYAPTLHLHLVLFLFIIIFSTFYFSSLYVVVVFSCFSSYFTILFLLLIIRLFVHILIVRLRFLVANCVVLLHFDVLFFFLCSFTALKGKSGGV